MGLIDKLFSNTKLAAWINHRNIYLLGIAIILCGLGWSNLLMSIGQFVLIGNWILELQFLQKWRWLKTSPILGIILSVYLLHLVGLAWTDNFDYGFKEIRNKVPLLVLPLIIGTSRSISNKEFRALIRVYIITVLTLSIFSYFKLFELFSFHVSDKRELAINISHIRYGLNIGFIVLLLILEKPFNYIVRITIALCFTFSLFTLELYTGLVCLIFTTILIGLSQGQRRTFKIFSILIVTLMSYLGFELISVYNDFNNKVKPEYSLDKLEKKTPNGEKYFHYLNMYESENGVFLWRYVAWNELKVNWNKRSSLPYEGVDNQGQELKRTLIRFLSSKGYKKDSIGIYKLTSEEIKAIENGIPNVYYINHNPIKNRIHRTLYEIETYHKTAYSNGFSIVMRWIYWKTAWHIIKDNFWFGVGTGDVKEAFQTQYEKDNSKLDQQYRRRSHNQYLAIWVAFGIIGLMVFLFSLIYPLFYINPNYKLIYWSFFTIATLSFLTEDTLETQAGVTFFALFNSLLLLGLRKTQPQTS